MLHLLLQQLDDEEGESVARNTFSPQHSTVTCFVNVLLLTHTRAAARTAGSLYSLRIVVQVHLCVEGAHEGRQKDGCDNMQRRQH